MTSTSRRSSGDRWSVPTDSGTVHVVATDRSHGDFHLDAVAPDVLARRRRAVVDLPWTMLDEVHGTTVVDVCRPGHGDRSRGDVAVTGLTGAALGVWVGDCAPVVIVADHGRFAVAHAGWRGLAAGVLDVAADAVADAPAVASMSAVLGPCLRSCCNEFGAADLDDVARRLGLTPGDVAGTTSWGTTSLDLPAAVTAVLARRGVTSTDAGECTGCSGRYFSHRIGRDPERQVVVAWNDGAP